MKMCVWVDDSKPITYNNISAPQAKRIHYQLRKRYGPIWFDRTMTKVESSAIESLKIIQGDGGYFAVFHKNRYNKFYQQISKWYCNFGSAINELGKISEYMQKDGD